MKGINLIAFLACLTVITASKLPIIFETEDDSCPAIDPCPPKLISHKTDCSKYYECQYGQKQLRSCAAGLYFSKSWSGCVSWDISDCASTPPTTTPTPWTTSWPTPGDCIDGDLLAHECKCEKFYECKNGLKALRDCPVGQIFNSATKSCRPGNKDTCIPDQDGCTVGENKPHECKCEKYYTCLSGNRWALRECGPRRHFDKTTLTCIDGEDCGRIPLCYNSDRKKHECDCTKYYTCANEEWFVDTCPYGQHFSESLKICTDPFSAGCDPDIIDPGACPVPTPSKWAHECDCRLYYQCVSGRKKIYDCNWGNYFDNTNLVCNAAANVKNCRNSWDDWL